MAVSSLANFEFAMDKVEGLFLVLLEKNVRRHLKRMPLDLGRTTKVYGYRDC